MERSTAIRCSLAALAAIAIAAAVGMAWLARAGDLAAPAAATTSSQPSDAAAPASGPPNMAPPSTPADATRTMAAAPADPAAPRATLRVHAIDESNAPVAGATIWLATSRHHLDELHADATLPREVTDSSGNATFADLAPAEYRIHVEHATLVYSHQLQDETHLLAAIAPRVPEIAAVTIRLAMPYVAALRVDGAEFRCSFVSRNAQFSGATNSDGQDALRRVQLHVQERFADAQTIAVLRTREAAQRGEVPSGCKALVWVAGREPWSGPLEFVPWPQFERPVTLGLADLTLSSDWATLVVHLRDALGAPLEANVNVRAVGFPGAEFGSLAVRDGRKIDIPAGGYYELASDEPLLQELLRRTGRFTAVARGHAELHVGQEHVWSRCRFVAIGGAPAPASLTLECAAAGLRGMQLIPSPTAGYECWVPEGRIVSSFKLKGGASATWHAEATTIATGGTRAHPQVIIHRLQQR